MSLQRMDGVNKLGRVIQQQINKSRQQSLVLDFGVIQPDYSLLTNTFVLPIPVSDYVVCRSVTYNPDEPLTKTWLAGDCAVDGGKHFHDVYLPDKMRWLKPGDRVLVAWVQNDAVVIDLIFEAKGVITGG